jgi:6-phosphogluconolactonase
VLKGNWSIFENIDKLSMQVADDILDMAKISIKSTGSFKIVLAGGKSLIPTYKILSHSNADWSRWHIYIGDERCLPLKNKERNDHNINIIWLNNSPIPKKNIHFIRAELDAKQAVWHYETTLEEVENFDVTLLSMGEDGHTASLFPGHQYDNKRDVVIINNSPKKPKQRISLSYSRLNQSNKVFKIISGSLKCNAVRQWLNNIQLPINQINGNSEKVYLSQNALP